MQKVREKLQGARTFLDDVVMEARKATWPHRRELVESTAVVIVSVLLLSLFVGISDKILATVLRLIIPTG
jgi:preprotein translocase subunit SecE